MQEHSSTDHFFDTRRTVMAVPIRNVRPGDRVRIKLGPLADLCGTVLARPQPTRVRIRLDRGFLIEIGSDTPVAAGR